MKNLKSIVLACAIIFGTVLITNAQDESAYAAWETIMLTPDNTKLKVLGENMRTHNMTYHKEGPHKAAVWQISTGPNAGKLIWQMGPLNYSHLDSRPAEGGHDEDWRDNVMPYVKKMGTIEYWKADNELNNTAMLDPNTVTHPILYIRFYNVNPGQGFSINTFFSRVLATVKSLEGDNPWGLYDNEFRQGLDIGRHIAEVSFYQNWTEFDKEIKWIEAFNKVNGANSWQNQVNMGNATFSNSWDEIWTYDKSMSGQ
jgi:hypothetical protein